MRRLALLAALIAGGAFALAATAAGEDENTYFIELDNAFGLVEGSEVKVAGVQQGVIEDLFITSDKRAVVKVKLSGPLSKLGEDTICSSEPQSLIAEYFIDCAPKGPPLAVGEGSEQDRVDDPDIPVEQTRQTVQNDLVLSALREGYRERLGLIINEFGTALAGNPENLNAAIRRGAPALRSARKVTSVLADQNRIIKNLNVNSDTIMQKLADRRKDVVRFIENAKDTAEVGANNREALSANFRDLDDFLAELGPTMVELNDLAVSQTPLLQNLRASAGGLDTISRNLPDFNSAATKSIVTLGDAAEVGTRALKKGADEIEQLRKSTKKAYSVADHLRKFLNDINDPGRAVQIDARAADETGRSAPTGFTGLEGLLNYVYYQAGALTQYDQISHMLHFSIFEVGTGPCEGYNAGPEVPAQDGGTTTNIKKAHRCVAWIGPNQPGINQSVKTKPYDGSVCPDGSADLSICDPSNTTSAERSSDLESSAQRGTGARGGSGSDNQDLPGIGERGGGGSDGGAGGGSAGDDIRDGLPGGVEGILDLPNAGQGGGRGKGGGLGIPNPRRGGKGGATNDLLGYLFGD